VWGGERAGYYLGVGVREIDATRAKELRFGEEAGVEVTRRGLPEGSQWERPPSPWPHSIDVPRPFLSWRSGMLGIEAAGRAGQFAAFF